MIHAPSTNRELSVADLNGICNAALEGVYLDQARAALGSDAPDDELRARAGLILGELSADEVNSVCNAALGNVCIARAREALGDEAPEVELRWRAHILYAFVMDWFPLASVMRH